MRNGRKGILILFFLVAAVAVFYGVRYLRRPVNTQTVKIAQHLDRITAEAYFVRTEHVYRADKNGTFYSTETEGARVGKQRQIASVYTGDINQSALTELNNLNKKIAEGEQTLRNSGIFSDETTENRTESVKNKIIKAAEENDIAQIGVYKEELAAAIAGVTPNETQASVDTLRQQKAEVEQRLSGMKQDIYSDISGVYTTNVDKLEGVLTPESVLTYTVSDFDALKAPEKKEAPASVAVGDEICKVVDNHTWSILVKVPADKLEAYRQGDKISLMFDSVPGIMVDAELSYKSEITDGFVAAVFTSEQYVEGIFTVRTGTVDIIFNDYTGYQVPIHAVRVVDGQTGVMKRQRGAEVFCACDVLYTNKEEGYAVVFPVEKAEHKLENGDYILLGEKTGESSS